MKFEEEWVKLNDCIFRRSDFIAVHRGRWFGYKEDDRKTQILLRVKGSGPHHFATDHSVKEVKAAVFGAATN